MHFNSSKSGVAVFQVDRLSSDTTPPPLPSHSFSDSIKIFDLKQSHIFFKSPVVVLILATPDL